MRLRSWLDQARVDLTAAVRSVSRYPLAALVAVVSLAGGIGGATMMLLLRDALFNNPPPYYLDPARLSAISLSTTERPRGPVPAPLFRDWAGATATVELAAAATGRFADVKTADRVEAVAVRPVTANLFSVLGVSPILGRTFANQSATADGRVPAMLGHRVWQKTFAGRTDVVGETFWLGETAYTVVGVLPPHFWYASMSEPIWTLMDARALAPALPLDVIARRSAEMTPQALATALQAATEMSMASGRIDDRHLRVLVRDVKGNPMGEAMGPMPVFLIGAAVLFTVLIACTNVAILMIAQWTAREHEIAIRVSIGADRWRIIRSLVTESLIIAVAGGLLGVAVTFALRGLVIYNAGELGDFNLAVRPSVILAVAVLTMAAGIIPGLAPALRQTRRCDNNPLMRLRTSDREHQRWRHVMVGFEIAVTVALLVVVGTILSATERSMNQDLGFRTEPLVLARVQNPAGVNIDSVLRRLKGVPGVASAAASLAIPMGTPGENRTVTGDGDSPRAAKAEQSLIGAGFLETLDVPLEVGRDFLAAERVERSRAALVSAGLARQLWLQGNPLGRTVSVDGVPYEVVGVVADYANRTLAPMQPRLFLPFVPQGPPTEMQFLIRTNSQALQLIDTLRRELTAMAPGTVVSQVTSLRQIVEIGSQEIGVTAVPLTPLIAIAMLLTAAGVYGVLAFAVTRRGTELAVRAAVGARRVDLMSLVATQSARVIAVGMLCGVGATFALTRLAQGSGGVFDSPGWRAFVIPMLIVALIGSCATWIPARRAMRTNPAQLLRST